MKCPQCESSSYRKNGHRCGRQNYLCKNCGRQFLEPSSTETLPTNVLPTIPVSHNGHTETSVAVGTPLSPVENLPTPTSVTTRPDSVGVTANELLQSLLSPEFLESSSFKQFVQKFQELQSAETGIAILLLDAENLKLDLQTEKFLADLCTYPLQVKIAFANWRNSSIGKHDTELYARGYQLIHVPSGPNSADAKMIALGSSIFLQYPTVKEVFVCSCDGLLTHLCNELQNKGLTVYWVQRQNNILHVENRNTGEVNHYSLAVGTEIPSFEDLIKPLEELIKSEHKSISEHLAQLSTIATLFQERRHLTLNNSASTSEIGEIKGVQKEEYIHFINDKDDALDNSATAPLTTSLVTSINSREELEKVLIEIIQIMACQARRDYIPVTMLQRNFSIKYKETADSIVKKLKLTSSLIKFFRSRPTLFKLALVETGYEVAIAVE